MSSANATQRKALEFGRIGIDAMSMSALVSVDEDECWRTLLIYVQDGACLIRALISQYCARSFNAFIRCD